MYLWPHAAWRSRPQFLLDLQLAAYPNDEERLRVKSQVPGLNGRWSYSSRPGQRRLSVEDTGDDEEPSSASLRLSKGSVPPCRSASPGSAYLAYPVTRRPPGVSSNSCCGGESRRLQRGSYHRIPPHLSPPLAAPARRWTVICCGRRPNHVAARNRGCSARARDRAACPTGRFSWYHNAVFDRMTPGAAVDEVLRM